STSSLLPTAAMIPLRMATASAVGRSRSEVIRLPLMRIISPATRDTPSRTGRAASLSVEDCTALTRGPFAYPQPDPIHEESTTPVRASRHTHCRQSPEAVL